MNFKCARLLICIITFLFLEYLFVTADQACAMQPPLKGEMKRYQKDKTLDQRIQRANALGNNKTDLQLIWKTKQKINSLYSKSWGVNENDSELEYQALPPLSMQGGIPSAGNVNLPVLLVDFPDYPHDPAQTVVDVLCKFFSDGDPNDVPYESLRNYYKRSSYGELNISGDVMGWYTAQHNRDYYKQLGDGPGQQTLIKEAMEYYDTSYDFSKYDNDNNGYIDAIYIKWTGPDDGWSSFWWSYQWSWQGETSLIIDGKYVKKYVWSWICNPEYDGQTSYHPLADIHETGHLLGLPDYYDYDVSNGPAGGIGKLDMMDGNWGDHNCFSKFMLGWIEPHVIPVGEREMVLAASGNSPDTVLIMPEATGDIYNEFFMAQYRKRLAGNDPPDYPADGMIIWHVDAALDSAGRDFMYNNSDTSHKLLRLMQADGLDEIENHSEKANLGDFYVSGYTFGPETVPNSSSYSGKYTNILINAFSYPADSMTGNFQILVPAARITADCEMDKNNLDDTVILMNLENSKFIDNWLEKENFVLNNAPNGTSIENVQYNKDDQASIYIGFDGTAFGTDIHNFSITVDGVELKNGIDITSNELIISAGSNPELPVDECFIATAAYGSKFETHVKLLRKFRDEYLLKNTCGKAIVGFYYRNSPPVAAYIADSGILRALVRVMLTPLIALVFLIYHPMLLYICIGLVLFVVVSVPRFRAPH